MLKTSLLLIFSILISTTALAKNSVPQFKNYAVKSIYSGKTAQLNLSDEHARFFRTRLRDALTEQPNFAGEYVITMWGCGASCRMYSIINKRTGQLLKDAFGGEGNAEDVIDSRASSNLLVTQQEHFNENYDVNKLILRFYILKNQRLKLIKTIETKPEKIE